MYELCDGDGFRIRSQFFAKPVFDCLDVVVDARLDGFDGLGIFDRKITPELVKMFHGICRQRLDLGQWRRSGNGFEPFDLDPDAQADQTEFAEMVG